MRRFLSFTLGAVALAVVAVVVLSLSTVGNPPPVVRKNAELNAIDISEPASPEQFRAPSMSAPAPPAAVYAEDGAASAAPAQITVSLPQLAYSYKLAFRLGGEKIARAQEAHRALCEKMGPARCQLIALSRGMGEDAADDAVLKVRIASSEAHRFSDTVGKMVAAEGGRQAGSSVTAEDVSKDIVDASARIRQRELLIARLTEILRSRNGKVAELIEAESSIADAQEELDKAKAWLAELRARVAMSDFEIRYSAVAPVATPSRAGSQIGEALADSGANVLIGIRGLVITLIYLLPWLVLLIPVGLLARWGVRRWKRAADRSGEIVEEAALPDDA